MGTFDILNMRINGFDFHMSLMAGEEDWDSSEVKQVFDTWRGLLPYHQADPLGRTWQEAATSMGKGESGMYLLGTFVVDAIPDHEDDLDFFTFPELDAPSAPTALDAPIDGFCLAAAGDNQDGGKEMMKCLGTAEAADAANKDTDAAHRRQRRAPTPASTPRCRRSRPRWSVRPPTSPSSSTATPAPTSPRP